jgi:formylmethanofuran dehydrogenase subunit E
MFRDKKKITATATLTCNTIMINDHAVEWLEAKEFDLASLAKSIGIDQEHHVKATITIELVEEPCAFCGNLTTGDKICQNCGKVICDQCAKTTEPRLCSICQVLRDTPKQPSE